MLVFENPSALATSIRKHYCAQESVGFVPTMGALHDGHGSLVARSASENPVTVVSIFVNPTQFGPNEDLDKYPRTLEADLELCRKMGATHIFTPTPAIMYPEGKGNFEVEMGLRSMDKILCGAKRPGHFNGVLQVVSKLFNIVRPDRAYFGEKDFQQLTILKTLARELFFPIDVIGCTLIREDDGLAMSSRNRYLSTEERKQALFLSSCLRKVAAAAKEGTSTADLKQIVQDALADYPVIRLDYFDIRSSHDLRSLDVIRAEDAPRGIMAAFCGKTRLIDNMSLV